jgi:hypothetical protein
MHEDYHIRQATLPVKNAEEEMNAEGIAQFNELRFPTGTRQKVVRLQFVLMVSYIQANGSPSTQSLESDLTQPFLIMTNENQWKVSEGVLLKKSAFEGKESISWPRVGQDEVNPCSTRH